MYFNKKTHLELFEMRFFGFRRFQLYILMIFRLLVKVSVVNTTK